MLQVAGFLVLGAWPTDSLAQEPGFITYQSRMCASQCNRLQQPLEQMAIDGMKEDRPSDPTSPEVTQNTETQEQLGACSAAVMPPALGTSTKKAAKEAPLHHQHVVKNPSHLGKTFVQALPDRANAAGIAVQ